MNVVLIPTYTVNTDMQFADNLYLDILEVESISVVVLLLLKQQQLNSHKPAYNRYLRYIMTCA